MSLYEKLKERVDFTLSEGPPRDLKPDEEPRA
jgi:hypothetical protein